MAMQICSICRKPFRGIGNDAYPFPGICCDRCKEEFVEPILLSLLGIPGYIPKEQKQ